VATTQRDGDDVSEDSLTVEQSELLYRAELVEAPVVETGVPDAYPGPPCSLDFVVEQTKILHGSINAMIPYLRTGTESNWKDLAESLRNAAAAYEEADQDSAAGIAGTT